MAWGNERRMSDPPRLLPRAAVLVWQAMLSGILLDFVLIAFAVMNRDSPLGEPGGVRYVLNAVAPLTVYGLALWLAGSPRLPRHISALRIAVPLGMAAGLLQVVHMVLENAGNRIGERSTVTLAFMLGAFLLWGVAGFLAARRTGLVKAAVAAGCASAAISVFIAVTFGLVLMTANLPSPAYVATWPEFQQSRWVSPRAFAIANSLDAVLSHLLIGPVVGVIVGFAGGGLARLASRRSAPALTQH